MIMGTWGAGFAGWHWGWVGAVVGGVLFGAVGGLLHAVATVTFGVDHVVSGVAINILAAGVVRFLSELHLHRGHRRRADAVPVGLQRPAGALAADPVLGPGPAGRPGAAALVPDQRRGRPAARAHQRRQHPHAARGAARAGRPTSCSGGRRSACGCGPAGRTRSAADSLGVPVYRLQVHRRDHLRCAGRARRGLPRRLRRHLPGGPDRRPRVHRAGGADLRQLAARRAGHGRGPVRLLRRAAAAGAVGDHRAVPAAGDPAVRRRRLPGRARAGSCRRAWPPASRR